jgi:hypothetical protein
MFLRFGALVEGGVAGLGERDSWKVLSLRLARGVEGGRAWLGEGIYLVNLWDIVLAPGAW